MKLYAITLFALVLAVTTLRSEAAHVPPNCPPRVCTREYKPVCGVNPKTGIEKTFSTNCTMLFRGCDHVYVRDGECVEDGDRLS